MSNECEWNEYVRREGKSVGVARLAAGSRNGEYEWGSSFQTERKVSNKKGEKGGKKGRGEKDKRENKELKRKKGEKTEKQNVRNREENQSVYPFLR
jgi:hypothetical protein